MNRNDYLIEIRYPNGSMRINLDQFFPTVKPEVIRLMKVVAMDIQGPKLIKDRMLRVLKEMAMVEKDAKRRLQLKRNIQQVEEYEVY